MNVEEWQRLQAAGYDNRTCYVLASDNPLAVHKRVEKLKADWVAGKLPPERQKKLDDLMRKCKEG